MPDTEQQGVSPASAGGASAPDFNAIRDALADTFRGVPLWQLRQGLVSAGLVPADVQITATDRKPVHGEPGIQAEWDKDTDAMRVDGIGWDLSWGCKVSFAYDPAKDEHYVCVSTSDADQRAGITSRRTSKEQLASLGQQLLNVFGEKDARDAEIERELTSILDLGPGHDITELLDVVKSRLEWRDTEIERLNGALRSAQKQIVQFEQQRDEAIDRLTSCGHADRREMKAVLIKVRAALRDPVDSVPDSWATWKTLNQELGKLADVLDVEVRQHDQTKAERDEAREEWKRADAEVTRLRGRVDELAGIRVALFDEVRSALTERDTAQAERDRLRAELDGLPQVYGRLVNLMMAAQREDVRVEVATLDQLTGELDELIGVLKADAGTHAMRHQQHVEFLQAEAGHWREKYDALRAAVSPLAVEYNKTKYLTPPEPPVGTRFVQPKGSVWTHKHDGWYCPGEECNNCPVDWTEAYDRVRDAIRYLPGVELPSPTEPRRWVAGDPEPEVGTTVTWGAGCASWSRHEDGDWRSDACDCETCLDAVGLPWRDLLAAAATSGGLVEVVSADG